MNAEDYTLTIDRRLGLYDSDTGKTLVADLIVDLSAIGSSSRSLIIKYAKPMRGYIVQICHGNHRNTDQGMQIHYFLHNYPAPGDLAGELRRMGLDKSMEVDVDVLANLIFRFSPASRYPY